MRKHPLIALSAFAAFGTSAIAGIATGPSHAAATSTAKSHSRAATRSGVRLLASRTRLEPLNNSTRHGHHPHLTDLIAMHDVHLSSRTRAHLDPHTGLPPRHHVTKAHKAAHHSTPATHVVHHTVADAEHTTTAPTTTAPPPVVTPAPAVAPAPPTAPSGGVWYQLRMCESGDNYAENTGNGYYGAYQFSLQTWYGLGFSGLPSAASPSVQDRAAAELQARSGWGQWPQCALQLGLI